MVPEEFIREQLNSVLSDMSVDVVSPFLPSFFFLPICLSKFHESLQLLYLSWFWFLLHSLVHKMLCDFHMCVMG